VVQKLFFYSSAFISQEDAEKESAYKYIRQQLQAKKSSSVNDFEIVK
jgi:hypothetical protein